MTNPVASDMRVEEANSAFREMGVGAPIAKDELSDAPTALKRVVDLSKEAENAPRFRWGRIEVDLKTAFKEFLASHTTENPERRSRGVTFSEAHLTARTKFE